MFTKTIEYTDYNGQKRKEDFYFNLTKTEISNWINSTPGGLDVKMQKIMDKGDAKDIIDVFRDLILRSYGEKSDDGRHFLKRKNGESLAEMFEQTPAYDVLYMELCTDAEAAAAFFTAVIPAEWAEELEKNKDKLPVKPAE